MAKQRDPAVRVVESVDDCVQYNLRPRDLDGLADLLSALEPHRLGQAVPADDLYDLCVPVLEQHVHCSWLSYDGGHLLSSGLS